MLEWRHIVNPNREMQRAVTIRTILGILGTIHVVFGILAITAGLVIFRIAKGTPRHRQLGFVYVASMLGLNGTGLLIYRVFGTFGPFHVLALASLVTLFSGFVPVYRKPRAGDWLRRHYHGMCWSYVGLLAATAAEIAVRLPIIRGFGLAFGIAVFVSSLVVVVVGGYVVNRSREQVLARFQRPRSTIAAPMPERSSPEYDGDDRAG
jgi:uncharacterized membrane protein